MQYIYLEKNIQQQAHNQVIALPVTDSAELPALKYRVSRFMNEMLIN